MNEVLAVFLSGFSIGILGSFHCIGMCGPLALSLPVNQLKPFHKFASIGLNNLGRSISYTMMGCCFGILGQSFSFFKIQQWLSIVAGVTIISILLIPQLSHTNFLGKFTGNIKTKLSLYLSSGKSAITYFNIGILNGLLPCGLVYVAIAASLAAGSILNSGILMFGFGLGTIPLMASTMIFGKFISFKFRTTLYKAMPYFVMCIAVLLILRGLNLGIPYVSPTHTIDQPQVHQCH